MFWTDLLVKVLIFPGVAFISIVAMLIAWFERKFLARTHLRIGPLYVGRYAGSLQLVADFIKLLSKELIVPRKADKYFFVSMPTVALFLSALSLAVIPFDETWVVFRHELSLLFVLALLSLVPIVILFAGWSSNNKYSFIGGMRATFQFLAYEVPLCISILGVVILSGSLDLFSIVKAQSNVWFIVLQPLGFLVCLISALGEAERTPFDIPEAESEIVFGWMTEYTGIGFGLFFFANYIRLYISTLLMSLLFLGGWFGPPFLPPVVWLLIKSGIVVTLIILIRASFPRVRIDQFLRIGWKILIPLAIANLLYTIISLPLILG